jgi:hypothetical protein
MTDEIRSFSFEIFYENCPFNMSSSFSFRVLKINTNCEAALDELKNYIGGAVNRFGKQNFESSIT